MDSTQLNNVETVEIEEPSDKVQVLSDEKTCMTRKHLYIIVGVVLVAAIALIGTLLGFTAASPDAGVTEQSLTAGVQSTFPTFDTNNDGYIDRNEMSNWMTVQIAGCKANCNGAHGCDHSCGVNTVPSPDPSSNGTVATDAEVAALLNPCDFNHDGKVSVGEMIQCAVHRWQESLSDPSSMKPAPGYYTPAAPSVQDACAAPDVVGFPGNTPRGQVGACKKAEWLWCYAHFGCQHEKHCQKSYIPLTLQTQAQCCVPNNCSECACGATYSFVPTGGHPNIARYCHKFADFYCQDTNTNVKCRDRD